MSVLAALKGQIDRIARGRQLSKACWTGTDFWARVDAAADETYENRVKGASMTTLDDLLAAGGGAGQAFRDWFSLHGSYFTADLSLSAITNAWETYLTSVGFRVPYEFGEMLAETIGESLRLSPEFVFPKGTYSATPGDPATWDLHKIGTAAASAVTASAGALPDEVIGGAVLLINETATTSVSSLNLTCTLQDATTKDLAVTLSGADQWAQTKLGSQAVGAAGAAAGQKVVPVAATAQFKAGEWVLIVHDDATQEKAQIATVTTNTSLTMESNLVNSFVENDLVLPLFTNVVYKSGSVAADKTIGIYALPDRVIAL